MRGRIRTEHLVALSVEACFAYASPVAVFTPTASGASARRVALLRLPVWTVGVSESRQTCQNLQFSYGVVPVHEATEPDSWNNYIKMWIEEQRLEGDLALLTGGPSLRHPAANHRIELIEL
jgi:pyruvate kinase